jgi:tRNA A-37 threonylcarbamoyl transferase component Bud32
MTWEFSMTTATRPLIAETARAESKTRVPVESCIFLARCTTPPTRALQAVVRTAVRRWAADAWSFDTADTWTAVRLITRRKIWQRKNAERTVWSPPTDAQTIVADEVTAALKDLPPEYARLLDLKIRPVAPDNATAATILGLSPATVERMMALLGQRLSARFVAERPMPANPLPAALPDTERAVAETLFINFERNWTQQSLSMESARLAGPHRVAILTELVRIDRDRRRAAGLSCSLNWYLGLFPELSGGPAEAFLSESEPPAPPMPSGLPFGPNSEHELQTELSRSATGITYLALNKPRSRRVAIKVFQPDRGLGDQKLALFQRRVLRSARILASFDHPNIRHIYEVGEYQGTPFQVLQHIDGLPLPQWRDGRKLTDRDAAVVARKLASAIHHAHARGMAHGDLQPSSVIVTEEGEPFLTDFSRVAESKDSVEDDLRDLGVIFFFLLTGCEHRSAPDAFAPVDPVLAAICRRAMANSSIADCFRSVGDFEKALNDYLELARNDVVSPRPEATPRRRWAFWPFR